MATEPIKPIGTDKDKPDKGGVNSFIENGHRVKKRITKGLLNSASFIVGFFLMFVVVVVFTTDINFASAADWGRLGLAMFVLLFCSYSMYVNFSDTGTKAGKESDAYSKALTNYDTAKKTIVDKQQQGRLLEFCRHYVAEEQRNARHSIIADVGLKFADYTEKYVGMSAKDLKGDTTLTKPQKKAILKANRIKPIRLTPEMFFRRGRGMGGRAPLSVNPRAKKGMWYVIQFCKNLVTVVLTTIIVLEVVVKPDWATFAACCLKLLTVVLSGFAGYKMGYENIVFDTVNYMSDQIDLMEQFQQYITDNPVPVLIYTQNGVVDTAVVAESVVENAENSAEK